MNVKALDHGRSHVERHALCRSNQRPHSEMTQDQESGAAASAWGRETAVKIARAIGATDPNGLSNECRLNGDAIVIKCAAVNTDQVGVTYRMLPHLRYVIGAVQQPDGSFDLYSLTPEEYAAGQRPTRSKGPSAGRVGKVRRKLFETKGKFLRSVRINSAHSLDGSGTQWRALLAGDS